MSETSSMPPHFLFVAVARIIQATDYGWNFSLKSSTNCRSASNSFLEIWKAVSRGRYSNSSGNELILG